MGRVLQTAFDPPNGLFRPRRFFESSNICACIFYKSEAFCVTQSRFYIPQNPEAEIVHTGKLQVYIYICLYIYIYIRICIYIYVYIYICIHRAFHTV